MRGFSFGLYSRDGGVCLGEFLAGSEGGRLRAKILAMLLPMPYPNLGLGKPSKE